MSMFAVVEIAGKQYKVTPNAQVRVDLLESNEGDQLKVNKVLLVADGSNTEIGMPYLSGKTLNATVLKHEKGDKVRIFKFRPKKRYRKSQGHRQKYTILQFASF